MRAMRFWCKWMQTFRIGLFGLDKLGNVNRSVNNLEQVVAKIASPALEQR